MKVLKFGGKSLATEQGLDSVLDIIKKEEKPVTVVLSARGKTTELLIEAINKAKNQKDYAFIIEEIKNIHINNSNKKLLKDNFEEINRILKKVYTLSYFDEYLYSDFLSQGELLSVKSIEQRLNKVNQSTEVYDSRAFIQLKQEKGSQFLNDAATRHSIETIDFKQPLIHLFPGFIASDKDKRTVTLGRNGSNYSASIIARYSGAKELLNYTHVDGIYTANPDYVEDAQIISELNYAEAHELANFGASVLHPQTISPLESADIPLLIKNTFNPDFPGTKVFNKHTDSKLKSVVVKNDISLISINGKALKGRVGLDAKIFNALSGSNINVQLIVQGSSERRISFTINQEDSDRALRILRNEFIDEFIDGVIEDIETNLVYSQITTVGAPLVNFGEILQALKSNLIDSVLFSNTLKENNATLLVKKVDEKKAVNIIHSRIFGVNKVINIAIVGKGTVGGPLIQQIMGVENKLSSEKGIKLNIFSIAGTSNIAFDKNGLTENWESNLKGYNQDVTQLIIDFGLSRHLENLVLIDNTASKDFSTNYSRFVTAGYDLISSNKHANSHSYKFYELLRNKLRENGRRYLYETNVGAGLPLVNTIQLLHQSGDNITSIKGVFSGSLSYLFNRFSSADISFSNALLEAKEKGFTEPDPREDLAGNDVARKLLILARELELPVELSEVEIENLVPRELEELSFEEFEKELQFLDDIYKERKAKLPEGKLLRYVGELTGAKNVATSKLVVKLEEVDESSPIGRLSGADSLFEIYTETYGDNPIIIQGAGAGAQVTARGVLGDLFRLVNV